MTTAYMGNKAERIAWMPNAARRQPASTRPRIRVLLHQPGRRGARLLSDDALNVLHDDACDSPPGPFIDDIRYCPHHPPGT